MRAKPRRAIDGVLLLDKPHGITSQRAVSRVKALTGAAKVGHTGTLDPMATGLLPLTFGEATKFSHALLDADKSYLAVVQLGVTTTTGDAEGEVLRREAVTVDRTGIEAVLSAFLGESEQIPPMYSALKYAGKPLYEYARSGIDIERRPRPIRIAALTLVRHDSDRIVIAVDCSKGTYIRVLAEDIGRALGCGASLADLRRTRVGRFTVDDAVELEVYEALDESGREARLMPVDALVQEVPRVDLGASDARRLTRGQSVSTSNIQPGVVRVYGADGGFLGVADVSAESDLVPRRLVSTNERKP